MLFTLGHSTLTEREFVQAARGIEVIVDVRSHPTSSHCPQFNRKAMERWLPEYGLKYDWWPSLGGWATFHLSPSLQRRMLDREVDVAAYARGSFPKQRITATRPVADGKPAWSNVGFHDFSWYMTTGYFLAGADLLIGNYGAKDQPRAAMVCAEAQWWRCHRGMIADYLAWRGVPCYHLPVKLPKRETTPRFLLHTDGISDRLERYDPDIMEVWEKWVSRGQVSAYT